MKGKGQQVGLRCVEDDPKMVHSLAASKLQSNLEYKRQSKEERGNYKIHADEPQFLQAKKSQAQASDLTYRNKLHDYTCDPEQLNVKHAKQAYKLQSDVSDETEDRIPVWCYWLIHRCQTYGVQAKTRLPKGLIWPFEKCKKLHCRY